MNMQLSLLFEPHSDVHDRDLLTRRLQRELSSLDLGDLRQVRRSELTPPSAKGDPVSSAEWLVTLSASGGVFATLITALQAWLTRNGVARTVKIVIGDDSLEVSNPSRLEQRLAIESFLRKYGQ